MVTRILLILLCMGILHTVNGCYVDPYPYGNRPVYKQQESEHEEQEQRRRRERERERSQRLMAGIDAINTEWGSGTIRYAAVGVRPGWLMRCTRRSPLYTTRWEELAVVR